MRRWGFLVIVLVLAGAGFARTVVTDAEGNFQAPAETHAVLDFPTVSTAYTFGNHFRTLLQIEMARYQKIHADLGVGDQFLGASVGYTFDFAGIANLSLLGGYGYDRDDHRWDSFIGFSHRASLLSLSGIKTFVGYDILLDVLRYGLAYNLWERDNWKLDAVGSAKIFGKRNFLGLSLGRDYFKGAGGGSKDKLELDLGVFVGFDIDEKKVGSGLSANIRF